ncbi:MAG: sulfite exporter TauE/SafE family protein [Bryobacteraceae bacterium]
MEIALGFIIAVFIAITGVGAGSMTTPMLVLLLNMPTKQAVGTALIFGAAVKILTTPLYVARRQVSWRALGFLLATGLPGVLVGTLLLQGVKSDLLTAFVGLTIVSIALLNLFRFSAVTRHDRTPWLAFVALPIGVEVGFSSAGAGALGALCLMNMTMLAPAAVVGTDLSFGLVLSTVGGGIHAALGDLNGPVLIKLLIGGAAGALAGGLLASRLPSKKLRFVLCLALVLLGANLGWRGLSDYWKTRAPITVTR